MSVAWLAISMAIALVVVIGLIAKIHRGRKNEHQTFTSLSRSDSQRSESRYSTGVSDASQPGVLAASSSVRRVWSELEFALAEALNDPEALHKSRVATRRLRELLTIEGERIPPDTLRRIRKRLRDVGRILGALRELEVADGTLAETATEIEASEAAVALVRERLKATAASRRREVTVHLEVARNRLMKVRSAALSSLRRSSDTDSGLLRRRVNHRSGILRAQLLALGEELPAAELHATRIAVKKLRYCVQEAVDYGFEGARVPERVLATLQDGLGLLQEREVLRPFVLSAQAATDVQAPERLTLERLREALDAQSASLRDRFRQMRPALEDVIDATSGTLDVLVRAPASVRVTAAALPTVWPGDISSARIAVFVDGEDERVREALRALSPHARQASTGKANTLRNGTTVTVSLIAPHFKIVPPEREFVWTGATEIVDFEVTVPETAPSRNSLLTFAVRVDVVTLATLPMDIRIESVPARDRDPVTSSDRLRQTAFASYARDDSFRVYERIASVRISANLDIFVDRLSLKPNERWKERLAQEISARDLFLLFWSRNALASKWVEWEWRTALAARGLSAIQIHPLERPDLAPPPPELGEAHMDDVFLRFLPADESA